MPDMDIVAAADLILEKPRLLWKAMASRAFSSINHKEMLDNEELDAVSVCTTVRMECTIYTGGASMCCGKPMCVTRKRQWISAAPKEKRQVLSIGFQPRGDEHEVHQAHHRSRRLGDITTSNRRRQRRGI